MRQLRGMCRRLSSWSNLRRLKQTGSNMKIKFTLIDYIIIILVICAVVFAFIHITSDDSSKPQKTAFDSSTINKIPENYMKCYKDGYIVKATVNGFNSSTGEGISTNGTVIWEDDDGGSDVKVLLNNENGTFLLGTYKNNPNSDIYIDSMTLESNGEKYQNLTEITLKGKNITSLNDLTSDIPNGTDYEVTTKISFNSLNSSDIQLISNNIDNHNKRFAIKSAGTDHENQLSIVRADNETISYGQSVLGNTPGVSDEIIIRIYNSSDSQINAIKNSSNVLNIRNI